MSLLPLSQPSTPLPSLSPLDSIGSDHDHPTNPIPIIFRRLFKVHQMDFELAAWQMSYLCISPRRVYRNVYYHKQTKNTWARDDPAMVILICGCLIVSAVAWGVVYSLSIWGILRLALLMIFRDFLASGVVIATCLWLFSKYFLLPSRPASFQAESKLEWAYAFDVHVNSFFPLYLSLYLLQIFLSPLITRDRWVCLWLGNTLYLAAFMQYTYITYLGFNALPFLTRSELLLFPLLPWFTTYVATLLGFNVSKWVLRAYFAS